MVNDLSVSELTNLGYREYYTQPYSHASLLSEIMAIRAQCNSATLMCVGGGKPADGTLKVVACANCLAITTQTAFNQPNFVGAAYWYLTYSLSFGFSPSYSINQGQADTTSTESNSRLSWHIDLGSGGWRLGSLTGLNDNTVYYKKIYLKYAGTASTSTPQPITTSVTPPHITTVQMPFHLTRNILVSWGYTFKERKVDLSNLNIGSIESSLFSQFIYLDTLILKNNKIVRLYPNTFKNCQYLEYLDLSYNRLTSLNVGDFNGATNLETIFLNNNLLEFVDRNTFQGLTQITTYSFANNPVTQIYTFTLFNGVLSSVLGTIGK